MIRGLSGTTIFTEDSERLDRRTPATGALRTGYRTSIHRRSRERKMDIS
jgi:hypothetical protein